jgi:hypothetical protein
MNLSKISLGCHNLTGGSSFRRSRDLVDCAIDFGILRFDVAPSYGLGTAERTLSLALGNLRHDPKIQITSKFGIEPPRFGRVMAWLREPVRFIRGQRPNSDADRNETLSISSPEKRTRISSHAITSSIDDWLARSFRALRVDYLSTYLSHEQLPDFLSLSFYNVSQSLLRYNAVGRVGCSGESGAVKAHLDQLHEFGTVAQVSILHAPAFREVNDLRLFNLGKFASKLAAALKIPNNQCILNQLEDACQARFLDDRRSQIAVALNLAQLLYPESTIIVNASSSSRLSELLSQAHKNEIIKWTLNFQKNLDFNK